MLESFDKDNMACASGSSYNLCLPLEGNASSKPGVEASDGKHILKVASMKGKICFVFGGGSLLKCSIIPDPFILASNKCQCCCCYQKCECLPTNDVGKGIVCCEKEVMGTPLSNMGGGATVVPTGGAPAGMVTDEEVFTFPRSDEMCRC